MWKPLNRHTVSYFFSDLSQVLSETTKPQNHNICIFTLFYAPPNVEHIIFIYLISFVALIFRSRHHQVDPKRSRPVGRRIQALKRKLYSWGGRKCQTFRPREASMAGSATDATLDVAPDVVCWTSVHHDSMICRKLPVVTSRLWCKMIEMCQVLRNITRVLQVCWFWPWTWENWGDGQSSFAFWSSHWCCIVLQLQTSLTWPFEVRLDGFSQGGRWTAIEMLFCSIPSLF